MRTTRFFVPSSLLATALAVALSSCGPKRIDNPPPPPDGDGAGSGAGSAEPTRTPAEILAASRLPEPQLRPLAGDPLEATIHRLKNGLTVYISTDRSKPRVSAWIAVRTGSRNDPASSTGLAHYLEHMLFKGTAKLGTTNIEAERPHLDRIAELYAELRAAGDDQQKRDRVLAEIDAETQKDARYAIPNELDQLYAALGIHGVNAFTTDDATVYTADVPSNRFAAWARVEGDRFTAPEFRLFYPELEAVYEEKNRTLDSPTQRVFQAMAKALFPEHPYGTQPTIGLVSHLKTPAFGDMVRYYQRWYVPNNMAIVLAGDIDAETAMPVLEERFGGVGPRPLPAPESLPGKLVKLSGRKQIDVVAKGENAVYLGWQAVSARDPELEAFEVMDLLLDNASSGLLNVDLVLSQKLPRAGSFGNYLTEAGYYVVWGSAREGQSHDEVERLLLGVVGKLKRGEFTQADIDAVVVNQEIAQKQGLESNSARVNAMSDAFTQRQSWTRVAHSLDRMRQVTKADVVRAASRLGPNYVAVRRVAGDYQPPKIAKPKITPVSLDTSKHSAFARSVLDMPFKPIEPVWAKEGKSYLRGRGPAGELIAIPNHKNDLVEVVYHWNLGSRRNRLLCFALDALDAAGAGKYGPAELKKRLYALGSSIEFSCDTDETEVSVSGIRRNLDATVELLRLWLGAPGIDRATLVKLAENVVSQRKDQLQEPGVVAQALALYARYGNDSPLLQDPSNAMLMKLAKRRGPAQIRREVGVLLATRHQTTYLGPEAELAKLGPLLSLGKSRREVPPPPRRHFRRVRHFTTYFADKTAAQSQIRIIYPHDPLPAPKRGLSQLYSEYIGGGMGALIFQELREARGLVYSAWGSYDYGDRPRDDAALFTGLGTQADKSLDALEALTGLLGHLKKPDPQRFSVAKNSLLESYRATRPDPRALVSLVPAWRRLGLEGDPRPGYFQAIGAAKPEALGDFATTAADSAPIIAIMGDSRRIDLAKLRKLGTVISMTPDRLVSW